MDDPPNQSGIGEWPPKSIPIQHIFG